MFRELTIGLGREYVDLAKDWMRLTRLAPVQSRGDLMMQKSRWIQVFAVGALALAGCASAEDASLKENARDAGRAMGTAAKEVGKGAKKVGKAVGKAAKEGAEAVKEGAKEFKRAVRDD